MKILEPVDDTLSTQVGEEIILLSMREANPKYFGLHGSAIRMWQLIETKTHSEEMICAVLQEEFEAPEEQVRQDVANTLNGLESRNLIRRR
ncbi:PqqD family protein [Terriglobus sp. RCC_193]|uniref:PqqD family protein n=1 Tax=Terriglobus sp. RCC_193 TaxID=3239218 RepID=UPI003525E4E4